MVQFIVVSATEGADAPMIASADRRTIRQQAMRHVRQHQREKSKKLVWRTVSQTTQSPDEDDALARQALAPERCSSKPDCKQETKTTRTPAYLDSDACHTPSSMGNSVQRAQIVGRLFEFLCPQAMSGREKVYHKLLAYFEMDATAMRAATNASLLRSLSVAKNDIHLCELSQRHHAASVRLVRDAVNSSDQSPSFDIVWAVDALYTHSVVPGTADTDERGLWRQHTRGFGALIQSYGVKRLKSSTKGIETLELLLDHLPNTLMEAIISRQPLFAGEPKWTQLLLSQRPSNILRLVILACRIPALLASMDDLARRQEQSHHQKQFKRSQSKAKDVYDGLCDIETDFQKWLEDWYRLSPADRQSSNQLPLFRFATTLPDFIYEQYDLDEPVTCFPSLMSAVGHVYYWTLHLIVRKALYELAIQHPDVLLGSETSVAHLVRAADESANEIVLAAPYLVSLLWPSPANNSIICGPLVWANTWFLASGNEGASVRCRGITDASSGQRSAAEPVCLPRSMAAWLGT